ncbi:CBS domain-containing protein [archaeon]|nr:CBS domain-containing protein [archaeon]
MQVKDIMVRNIISVEPDENVSVALAKMKKNKINQLVVMKDKKMYGMLELRKIVTKDLDPSSTKISGLSINVPTVDINANTENVAELLLHSGLRALPVVEGTNIVGIVSESDMMGVVKSSTSANTKISDISSAAEYVPKDATIGKVKRIMIEKNVSRVPIVDKNKVVGIISTLDLIRIMEGKERMPARGGRLQEAGAKEKINIDSTPVEMIMRSPVIVSGNEQVREIIDILHNKEEVVVQQNGQIGLVTPRDVLEMCVASPKKQIYVQITGMQDESIEFKARMDIEVSKFVQKMEREVGHIEYLVFHVDSMHKQGPKQKYSLRARFKTSAGLFVAHSWGWKPLDVIDDVFKNLEREISHTYGKREEMKKRSGRKNKYR